MLPKKSRVDTSNVIKQVEELLRRYCWESSLWCFMCLFITLFFLQRVHEAALYVLESWSTLTTRLILTSCSLFSTFSSLLLMSTPMIPMWLIRLLVMFLQEYYRLLYNILAHVIISNVWENESAETGHPRSPIQNYEGRASSIVYLADVTDGKSTVVKVLECEGRAADFLKRRHKWMPQKLQNWWDRGWVTTIIG